MCSRPPQNVKSGSFRSKSWIVRTSYIKTSNFIAVVVQRGQRNVQKSVMHVQSCCSTSLNLLLFAVLVAVAGISHGIYIYWRPNYSFQVSFPPAFFRLPVEFIQEGKSEEQARERNFTPINYLLPSHCYSLRLHDKTYKTKLAGGGSGAASFSAPGFVFIFFFISFFNFSFGSDPIKRSL